MSDSEDRALVARCREGHREAFGELVTKYGKAVFNIAYRMVGRYEDAQDIAQTVFLKAYERLGQYDQNRKFFSWIYRMAVNESINFIHRGKPEELVEATHTSDEPSPLEALEQAERDRRLEQAVLTLSPDHRAVIILRHLLDLPYEEIARLLAIPEKKVKSRLFSARRLLCERLVERGVTAHD